MVVSAAAKDKLFPASTLLDAVYDILIVIFDASNDLF